MMKSMACHKSPWRRSTKSKSVAAWLFSTCIRDKVCCQVQWVRGGNGRLDPVGCLLRRKLNSHGKWGVLRRRTLRETGQLLSVFLLGSFGTILGTLAAFKVLPLASLGEDGWKVSTLAPILNLPCFGGVACTWVLCDWA